MTPFMSGLLAFTAVAFGIIAVALLFESLRTLVRRRDLEKRLDRAMEQLQQQTLVERELIDTTQRRLREAQELARRLPIVAGTSELLLKAGLSWSPATFLVITLGFAFAGGIAPLLAGFPLLMGVAFAALFGSLPYLYARRRRSVALRRFEELLPEAIDYLGRAIRAGHPIMAGVQMVGDELADPMGAEFRRMFDQQRFGVPFEETLLGLCDRVELVDVRIFATSVLVQREVGGGNFAEVLDNMADTIRSRFAIRREINVYTAQGRMSGMVAGAMPFLVGLGIYLQDPDYVRVLFDHKLGRIMAVSAVVMQLVGFFWIRKIVDVEV